jgi:L-iditol 2-dehydrogenase
VKALLLTDYRKLELVDFPEPPIGRNDVLVRVRACGICGSDVHGWDGSTGRRRPPLIMGHEASGEVTRVGAEVEDLAPGDRVAFDSLVSCGECWFCRRGDSNLCERREVVGVSPGDFRRHGAFAEFVAVPRRIVHRLPEAFPWEQAALIEAVAVGVQAVSLAPPQPGQTALVVGAGMIGSVTCQAAKAAGYTRVAISDVDDSRLAQASGSGADLTLNPDRDDLPARLRELTHGRGADAVFECVGHSRAIITAIDSVRSGGTVILVGNASPEIQLPLQKVVMRQIRLQGSCASNNQFPHAIELMASGAIAVSPFISAVAPLAEGPSWFERLYWREPGLMKVVLCP